MKKIIYLLVAITFYCCDSFSQRPLTVADYDGNIYNAITIGTQVWMKQNLRVTHFNNGDPIENVTSDSLWFPPYVNNGYCNYNDDTSMVSKYGRLYAWHSLYSFNKIAPEGWRIPTKADWDTLVNYLGGANVAGGKLKETGFDHWQSPNTGATNESYFTALPGGCRISSFFDLGQKAHFWTSTEENFHFQLATSIIIEFDRSNLIFYQERESAGLSVRCIRNKNAGIEDIEENEKINIFPNPAINKLTVNFNEEGYSKLQIINMLGESVMQLNLIDKTNEIDIGNLPKGVYIIRVSNTNIAVQKKIIKN